jgi:tRNA(adenine34) deaminase
MSAFSLLDPESDERWMREALREAALALEEDEVPVGAVAVRSGAVVGRGRNAVERLKDATAHAEILAIGSASERLGDWRLAGVTLYVTKEPCIMCAGAVQLSRVERVVFGAFDADRGAMGSAWDLAHDPYLHHRPRVLGGVLESECAALLKRFFDRRRSEPAT